MRIVVLGGLVVAVFGAGAARAQGVTRRYVEPLTDGVALPMTPLAGEHDARAVVANPGGMALIRGSEATLALDLQDQGAGPAFGQGLGAYAATTFGGRVLPRLAIGAGLEWLEPARDQVTPDPGRPFRLTLGVAGAISHTLGAGVTWHHFHDSGALGGGDAFDVGLSWRACNYLALGAVVHDLATAAIAGVAVQRRYEAEAVVRPLASDTLEVALGGRIGETRGDLTGWGRAQVRVARGLYLQGQIEGREVQTIVTSAAGVQEQDGRELRATLGFELSFGGFGVAAQATGGRDLEDHQHALGGVVALRASSVGPAAVTGTPDHIERVDLAGTIGLRELTLLVARLRAIGRDPTAKAIVVTFDGASGGWATLEELRDELVRLRTGGKKIFAYLTSGTSRDYYIATAAHKIYIDPVGGLRLVGLAGTTMYFRGAFDLFGVTPEFEKIGEYKSAPEQFTRTGPSELAAKMRDELYDSIWDRWVATVGDARHLSRAQVLAIIDGGPYTAGALAGDHQLVDAVAGPEKISQLIVSELGEVLPITSPEVARPERWQRPGVAVIYVDGDITDGKSRSVPLIGQSLAGGETLIEAIAAARSDPKIRAIILRISSPGGSAVASELVAREVFATRGVKPILCSMSDVAASGGYFIAAGCDLIYAEPMTITGSIGIFSGKFELGALAARLGITVDTFKRGRRSDLESIYRPYTEDERAVVRDGLRYMYGRFVGAVAEGRGLPHAAVDAVGRGHVWTGAQALPIHLVDRFGGLEDVIAEAKQELGLDPGTRVQLYELPDVPSSLLGSITSWLRLTAAPAMSAAELPAIRALLRGVPGSILVGPDVPQARLPFTIDWQ